MMSQHRNTGVTETPAAEAVQAPEAEERRAPNLIDEQHILDAAYELLLAVGMRRMTMADIARAADVSRATLYRRWRNVREVVATLMTREWTTLANAELDVTSGTARERLVGGVVRLVRASRDNRMLRKIIEVDPEFLLPYLLHRRGTNTTRQLELIEHGIRLGIADGSIRDGDVAARAESVLLTAWSFALTGPAMAEAPGQLDAIDDQLHELLERYLAP
ncbi:TetR/AcrR family transcriptional regulator [Haloechinothrix halophila]|nr:TetR/AcrR family transcriptional regulator [Haloechinothrix halophila]